MAGNVKFSELTRVQMPALVHLTRLGYKYFGKINENSANTVFDPDTNILLDVFGYNEKAFSFYEKNGYHTRLIELTKMLENNKSKKDINIEIVTNK